METDFVVFNQWVSDRLGVQLAAYKESQMQRRILTIMEHSGAKNLQEYQRLLEKDVVAREAFLAHITINVTEFYRNKELFDAFEKTLLTKIVPQFALPKIWSAACSIGAEPYTIAMLLEKNRLATPTVLATDIDQQILTKAKQGVYREHELRNVPIEELANYCHVIVCRNVTIYFKSDARDEVYQKFSDALVPGGILFTGATETINFSEKFGLKKIDSFIYQKI